MTASSAWLLPRALADDAFIRDVKAGIYFDPDKMHVLDHKGEYLSVRGPLNIARPVQGWPVIVQAGSSEAGRQLAAETAEVVFGAQATLAGGQRFYADVKGRMAKLGRPADSLKILPGAFVVVGETVAEAREKRERLDGLVHFDSSIASLSVVLGQDASRFDPERPLAPIPPTNASQSGRERVLELAEREKLNVRQLAQRLGGYAGLAFVGTPATIADEMEAWLESEGSDGFNVLFPYLPEGLDDFVERVVPELQRRGIFRREYEGTTLRESLGPPPEEPLFPQVTRTPPPSPSGSWHLLGAQWTVLHNGRTALCSESRWTTMLPASAKDLPASADVGIEIVPLAPSQLPFVEAIVEPCDLDAKHLDRWIRALGAFVPLEFG
jgi:alkanesulfonate monooxygenase SsuD/methylene tetrahydromethanopterin reductase-like flavin-dependent oxidoreductase (luciferase family)